MQKPITCSKDFYEADPELKAAVDFLVGEEMLAVGSEEHLDPPL